MPAQTAHPRAHLSKPPALWATLLLLPLLVACVIPACALAAAPEAPEASVKAVRATEATFGGTVNPLVTEPQEGGLYEFLYRPSSGGACHGGSRAPTSPGMYFGEKHEELPDETVSGLLPSTEYAACLHVEDQAGEATSAPVTFKTPEATAPSIESEALAGESKDSARLSATINPNGVPTSCEVRFGKTEALEDATPCPSELSARSVGQSVEVPVAGLQPNTEYHYQLVATNEKGTTQGTAATFTTHPFATVTTGPATQLQRGSATLNGTINPEGTQTLYYYEYGTAPCTSNTCGVRTATRGPITEEGAAEAFSIRGLQPGTSYHYWLVASNSEGTAHGEEVTFQTASVPSKEYVFEKDLTGYTFASPVGVAIDQATGDVYATDEGNGAPGKILQYDASGVLQSTLELPQEAEQVAVDNSCYERKLDAAECHAQDPSDGDVYVADLSKSVIYKYDKAGIANPADESALVADPTTPKIGEGVLSRPFGVAINSSGDVYAASPDGTVSKFSPTGNLLQKELITGPSPIKAVALDAAGDIYVASSGGAFEYTAAGTCVEPEPANPPEPEKCIPINSDPDRGIALDSAGDIFVADRVTGTVQEYASTPGHPRIANRQLEVEQGIITPSGVAVNDSSQRLYVVESGSLAKPVKVFEAGEPAAVSTQPPDGVGSTTATLSGTVDPGGAEPTEYYFEYGTAPCDGSAGTCGSQAAEPSQVPIVGTTAIPVAVHLDSLTPNTTYHYWVVAFNELSGIEHGEEQTFTTGPEPGPAPPGDQSEHKTPLGAEPAESPAYPDLTGLAPVPGPKETLGPNHPLTRVQRLQKALRACHRDSKVPKRKACERTARRLFGPKHRAKKKR